MSTTNRNWIMLFVGASGSGKTTIANKLEQEYGLKQIRSYTTRQPRNSDDDSHTFISDEQFDKLTDLVGYTDYGGYRYCATAQQVEESDIYVIDPAGVEFFNKTYKGDKEVVIVYFNVSQAERISRMLGRGDDYEAIEKRLDYDAGVFTDKAFNQMRDMCNRFIMICGLTVDSTVSYITERMEIVK